MVFTIFQGQVPDSIKGVSKCTSSPPPDTCGHNVDPSVDPGGEAKNTKKKGLVGGNIKDNR